MTRARRAAAVFLLTLAVAIPAIAVPGPRRMASKGGVLETFWARLAVLVGIFDDGRAGADPDGGTATPPAQPTDRQLEEGDGRAGADPNG